MKKFYKKVRMNSRKEMVDFLSNHLRYSTMNSWNRTTSYANNLKIHSLGLPQNIINKLFDMLDVQDIYIEINDFINEWGSTQNYRWQAKFNGRSGGYLVLYEGKIEPSGYKSYCTSCGQLNWTTTAKGNMCGRCRQMTRVDFPYVHKKIVTYSGRSIDQEEDFADWDMYSLRKRVRLVQSFDKLCDDIVEIAVAIATNYNVIEIDIPVPKKIKILQEV